VEVVDWTAFKVKDGTAADVEAAEAEIKMCDLVFPKMCPFALKTETTEV
jgi:hypothetical protein